jgi:hypothetical protein
MLPSAASCHFIPLRSKPSCSKIPSICILPLTLETMFHTHTNITGVFQYTNNTYEYLAASKASTEICPQIYTCRYKTMVCVRQLKHGWTPATTSTVHCTYTSWNGRGERQHADELWPMFRHRAVSRHTDKALALTPDRATWEQKKNLMYFIPSSVYIEQFFPNYLLNLLLSSVAFRPYLGHHPCFHVMFLHHTSPTSVFLHWTLSFPLKVLLW